MTPSHTREETGLLKRRGLRMKPTWSRRPFETFHGSGVCRRRGMSRRQKPKKVLSEMEYGARKKLQPRGSIRASGRLSSTDRHGETTFQSQMKQPPSPPSFLVSTLSREKRNKDFVRSSDSSANNPLDSCRSPIFP